MGAFKEYFEYEMHMMGCGIPYIILEGNAEDYKKIKSKAEKLSKYEFDWYINPIIPHINKTDIDNIPSLKASVPLATKESELTSFPFFFTYNPKINLTIIPAIKIIKVIEL